MLRKGTLGVRGVIHWSQTYGKTLNLTPLADLKGRRTNDSSKNSRACQVKGSGGTRRRSPSCAVLATENPVPGVGINARLRKSGYGGPVVFRGLNISAVSSSRVSK